MALWWVNGYHLQEGICHTQVCCTQSPHPCGRPLLIHNPQETLTERQVWLSRSGVSWCAQGFAWALQVSLAGMEFDSVRGVCNFLSSVLPQQKFEATDGLVLQLGITLTFICQAKENTSSRHEGGLTQKKWREEKWWGAGGSIFGSSFLFFLLPLSLHYINWASKEGCLLHLMFSLQSSDLPLFYFHGLFPFFVF